MSYTYQLNDYFHTTFSKEFVITVNKTQRLCLDSLWIQDGQML